MLGPAGGTSPGLVCSPTWEHQHVQLWSPALPLGDLQGNILKMKIKVSVAVSHVHSTSPMHPHMLCSHKSTMRHTHTCLHTDAHTHTVVHMHRHAKWRREGCGETLWLPFNT